MIPVPPPPPPPPAKGKIPAPDLNRGTPVPGVVRVGIPGNPQPYFPNRVPTDLRNQRDWTGNNSGRRATQINNGTGYTETCQVNGGVHNCSYWVIPKGGVYPDNLQPCRVKTALVGVDMDFYRCADPQGQVSIAIDTAYVNRRIAPERMRGRQYFCYHHLGLLFGVIPRPSRPPQTGMTLRAVSDFPAFAIVATFSMNPRSDQETRNQLTWPNPRFPRDPVTPLGVYNNMLANVYTIRRDEPQAVEPGLPRHLGQAIPQDRSAGSAYTNIFNSLCYRDLADYAIDARRNKDNPAQQLLDNPGQCQASPATIANPPAINNHTQVPLIGHGGALPFGRIGAQDLERNASTKSIRNQWCWEPLAGEQANCDFRRVRYKYFEPPLAGPVSPRPLTGGVIRGLEGPYIERVALYTLVAIRAQTGPGRGIDLVYDREAGAVALGYCPTPTNPLQTCNTTKDTQFRPRPGE